jgi:hypothetical protein
MNKEPFAVLRLPTGLTTVALADLDVDLIRAAESYRTIRWYRGQRNYAGYYWFATTREHLTYESRLEMACLQVADFDPRVVLARSQPFLIQYTDPDGRARRHVPDFAFVMTTGPVRIVNVKPVERLAVPEVRDVLAWAGAELERVGFAVDIWSGESPTVVANLRLLGGYRNPALFDPDLTRLAQVAVTNACSFHEAEKMVRAAGIAEPRPMVLHLIWRGDLLIDLGVRLTADSAIGIP